MPNIFLLKGSDILIVHYQPHMFRYLTKILLAVSVCVLTFTVYAEVQVIVKTPSRIAANKYLYMGSEHIITESMANTAVVNSDEYIEIKNALGLVNSVENGGEELIFLGVYQPVNSQNPMQNRSGVSVQLKNFYPDGVTPPKVSLVLSSGESNVNWSLRYDSGIRINKVFIINKNTMDVFISELDMIHVASSDPERLNSSSRFQKVDVLECGYTLPSAGSVCNTNKIFGISNETDNYLADATSLHVTSFSGAKHAEGFEVRLGENLKPILHASFTMSESQITWDSAFSDKKYLLVRETAILDQEYFHIFGTSPIIGYSDETILQQGGFSYTLPEPSTNYYKYRLVESASILVPSMSIPVYLKESISLSTSGGVRPAPHPFYFDVDPNQIPLADDITVSWPSNGSPYYRLDVMRDGGYWQAKGHAWEILSYQQENEFILPLEWRTAKSGKYALRISSCTLPSQCSLPLQQSKSDCLACNTADFFKLTANKEGITDRQISWSNASTARYLLEAKALDSNAYFRIYEGSDTAWEIPEGFESGTYEIQLKACKDLTSECTLHGTSTVIVNNPPKISHNGFFVSWSNENTSLYKMEARIGTNSWAIVYQGAEQLYFLPAGSPTKEYRVTGCVNASTCGEASTSVIGGADNLNLGTYNLLHGDYNGDGVEDVLVQSQTLAAASYVFIANENGTLKTNYQQLTLGNLGFDISNSVSMLQVLDKNGDGRDDIEIMQNGGRVAVLLSDDEGMFPTLDEEPELDLPLEQIFEGLCRAFEANNPPLASKYFVEEFRAKYEQVFIDIGSRLTQMPDTFENFVLLKDYDDYRSYAMNYRGQNDELLVGIVIFRRGLDGAWHISSM